jgi:hypothetical protein
MLTQPVSPVAAQAYLWSGVVDSGRVFLSYDAAVEQAQATFVLAPA